MNDVYRMPTTSDLPEVHVLFQEAKLRGIGTEDLANKTGYSRDAISTLRRPRKGGQGFNPSHRMVRDIAECLGYEFKLVRKGWRGQDESSD
ncbi:MAG: hypothetical protein RIQ99_473 [Pseudomonadota bacterium]|jgi:transcriptional regulator with XRE-family HTH domain